MRRAIGNNITSQRQYCNTKVGNSKCNHFFKKFSILTYHQSFCFCSSIFYIQQKNHSLHTLLIFTNQSPFSFPFRYRRRCSDKRQVLPKNKPPSAALRLRPLDPWSDVRVRPEPGHLLDFQRYEHGAGRDGHAAAHEQQLGGKWSLIIEVWMSNRIIVFILHEQLPDVIWTQFIYLFFRHEVCTKFYIKL